jgi:hypothetical protein
VSLLGTHRLQHVELHWPRWGTAWARVSTQVDPVAAGPAVLTIGDLVLAGTVLADREGESAPAAWSGLWVNGAGWDTVLPVRDAYQSDDGVRLKTVLTDLAKDCGALVIVQPTDASLGAYWTRPKLNADRRPRTGRDELNDLTARRYVPASWWVDFENVTRWGGRTSGAVGVAARVMGRDLARGVRHLGVDSPASFVPGGTFEGARIGRVVIREQDDAGFTVETWT